MSVTNGEMTIYEAMQSIKNHKFVMPAFQRSYVWKLPQIELLWDSILSDYPISTFLFWHIDENNSSQKDSYFCTFPQEESFRFKWDKTPINERYSTKTLNFNISDTAILDGQQRLTSLWLSLYRDVTIREKYKGGRDLKSKLVLELNKNLIKKDDEEDFNIKQFDIQWTKKVAVLTPSQFEIKTILKKEFQNKETRNNEIEKCIQNIPDESKEYAKSLLFNLCKKIYDDKIINFIEMKNTNQDDSLEMFVRFNNGGKPLSKSEITASILEAYWPGAENYFNDDIYKIGKQRGPKVKTGAYKDFDQGFIIRTSLMLYGDVSKSEINKSTAESLRNNWKHFIATLGRLEDLFENIFHIPLEDFSSRWNVLLPIIYVIHFNRSYMDYVDDIKTYLMRAIFFQYFKSGTTGKLKKIQKYIQDYGNCIKIEMLQDMDELKVTDAKIEDLLSLDYNDRRTLSVLKFLSIEWLDSSKEYDIDHIHPKTAVDECWYMTPSQVSSLRKKINLIPNLQILDSFSNKEKGNRNLRDWFNSMLPEGQNKVREQGMIPNCSYEFEDFDSFYEERKNILEEKLRNLLG